MTRKRVVYLVLVSALFFNGCKKEGEFIYVEDGRLYHPGGKEMALWGINLQPCLSWEYESLFALAGIPLDADTLKRATDDAFDEIQKMNCDVIRCHLTPSDYTDDKGNLVETVYLDLLDYMVAEASRRGMYVNLSLLNTMSFDLPYEDPWAHTHFTVENSFMANVDRKSFLCDKEVIKAVTGQYMYSYEKDLSIFSSPETYMHSGEVPDRVRTGPVPGVNRITGYERSPLVSYTGNGVYNIEISEKEILINIELNAIGIKPLWGKDFLAGPVTRLDHTTPHTMTINLEDWSADECILYRTAGNGKHRVDFIKETGFSFKAIPGEYTITRKEP